MSAEAWRDGVRQGGLLVLLWLRDMPPPDAVRLLEAMKRDPATRARAIAAMLGRTPPDAAAATSEQVTCCARPQTPQVVNCSPVAPPETPPQVVTCSPVATPATPPDGATMGTDGATMEAKRPPRQGKWLARAMGWTDGATMGQRWGNDI